MNKVQSVSILTALLSASRVAAHGHVTNIVVNGVSYAGFDIGSYPYMDDPPKVAAWTTPNTGNGFVDDYSSEDIICHQDATNAQGYVSVKAGDSVSVQWTEWPESHHGPVIDYLADCGDDCTTVDKTSLEFFKIDGVGLVDNSEVPGVWGDDQLINNNNTWLVQIPESIAPGNYVLRHELIALHGAQTAGGAQNYPQCFNLQVTGSGTDKPAGTKGTELYTADAKGIVQNIYASISSYPVPGPTLYSGASSISQATSAVTSTGTATVGAGKTANTAIAVPTASASASASSAAPSTLVTASKPATSAAAATSAPAADDASSTTTEIQSSTQVSTATAFQTSTAVASVTVTGSSSAPAATSSAPASSAPASSGGAVKAYGQCGGLNYEGATECPEGFSCHKYNPYYSQCVSA